MTLKWTKASRPSGSSGLLLGLVELHDSGCHRPIRSGRPALFHPVPGAPAPACLRRSDVVGVGDYERTARRSQIGESVSGGVHDRRHLVQAAEDHAPVSWGVAVSVRCQADARPGRVAPAGSWSSVWLRRAVTAVLQPGSDDHDDGHRCEPETQDRDHQRASPASGRVGQGGPRSSARHRDTHAPPWRGPSPERAACHQRSMACRYTIIRLGGRRLGVIGERLRAGSTELQVWFNRWATVWSPGT